MKEEKDLLEMCLAIARTYATDDRDALQESLKLYDTINERKDTHRRERR